MILTAIRHTRVEVPAGICYGQSDVPLASTYTDELEQVRLKLTGAAFDAVYCSPLSRCRTLAGDLFPSAAIQFDERLLELNFGQWELQSWDHISPTPDAQAWFADYVDVRTPSGESFRDQLNRTASFVEELKQKQTGRVAVVAHGGILRALRCLLNGTDPQDAFQHRIDYGEVICFEI